jgi:hypothetical protein
MDIVSVVYATLVLGHGVNTIALSPIAQRA